MTKSQIFSIWFLQDYIYILYCYFYIVKIDFPTFSNISVLLVVTLTALCCATEYNCLKSINHHRVFEQHL